MKNKNKQTKFPVARIKKIMQKDEEVGKVAQATPIVISKALELFLGMIVEEANKVTKDRGSKKVEAYHLKHAVETTEMLDFLKEIVESVPDPTAGGTVGLDTEGAETKKKRGKGRKGLAAAGGEGGEGSTAPKRKRKPKKGKDEEVKEEDEKERDENGDTEMGDEEGSAYYRPKSPVGSDEEEDKPFMPRR